MKIFKILMGIVAIFTGAMAFSFLLVSFMYEIYALEKVDTVEVQCVDGNNNNLTGNNLHCYKDLYCLKTLKFFNDYKCRNYEGYN